MAKQAPKSAARSYTVMCRDDLVEVLAGNLDEVVQVVTDELFEPGAGEDLAIWDRKYRIAAVLIDAGKGKPPTVTKF